MALLFEILAELLLQLVVEFLAEIGVRWFDKTSRETRSRKPDRKEESSPWMAALGYAAFGAAAGYVSTLIFPEHMTPEAWRYVHLLVTPVLAGIAMMLFGRWRQRRGDTVLRIDRFACGYLFALAFALVRLALAE